MFNRTIKMGVAEYAFAGLVHQNLDFQHAVGELVDNAIAASPSGKKALVQILLLPHDDVGKLTLVVADWGCGMNFDKLQECMQLGYKSKSGHPLNQHGFGIKNALTVLSGGGTWQLASRENESEPYTVVQGPFQMEMPANDEGSLNFLPANVHFAYPNPRTVICVGVARSFARTATRKTNSTSLPVLRNWLIEHLGVMYRGYLSLDIHTMEPKAKIIIVPAQNVLGRYGSRRKAAYRRHSPRKGLLR